MEDSKRIRHPGVSGTSLKTSVLLATPFTLVSCSGISLRVLLGAEMPWLTSYSLHSELPIDRQKDPYLQHQESYLLTKVKGMHASKLL